MHMHEYLQACLDVIWIRICTHTHGNIALSDNYDDHQGQCHLVLLPKLLTPGLPSNPSYHLVLG